MPTQTIIDSPFATLWYYPDKKIVHHQIHKFVHGEEFQAFSRSEKWIQS